MNRMGKHAVYCCRMTCHWAGDVRLRPRSPLISSPVPTAPLCSSNRVGTDFVCLHVADPEDLASVSECIDAYPDMYVDIAARIGEFGCPIWYRRGSRWSRRASATILRGTVSGLGLPESILRKVYWENASRSFKLPHPKRENVSPQQFQPAR